MDPKAAGERLLLFKSNIRLLPLCGAELRTRIVLLKVSVKNCILMVHGTKLRTSVPFL